MLEIEAVQHILNEPDASKRIESVYALSEDEAKRLSILLLKFFQHPNPTTPCADS